MAEIVNHYWLDNQDYVFDSRLEPYRAYEDQIAGTMQRAISGHSGNEIDGFGALEHNPEEYPFQRADCIGAIGSAATYEGMKKLAPIFFPSFENRVKSIVEERPDLLSHMAGVFESGEDITCSTDHRQVIGVAIDPNIIAASLYRSGEISHGAFDTEIMVSLMLKYTKVRGFPAFPLMKDVFSMTRPVVPHANRDNKGELPEGYSSAFNPSVREHRALHDGLPRFTAIASSATRDIYVPRVIRRKYGNIEKGYYLAPPTDGTAEEFFIGKHVLITAIDLAEKEQPFYIGRMRRPSQIENTTEVFTLVQETADGISHISKTNSIFVTDMERFLEIKSIIDSRKKSSQ